MAISDLTAFNRMRREQEEKEKGQNPKLEEVPVKPTKQKGKKADAK